MHVEDPVYGEFELTHPLLLDLIDSRPMQRLKGISQAGFVEPYFPGTDHSRFEHSLGVCHLLSRVGAPLVEQVAGLLHDISHTAFSHCVDYALEGTSGESQGYQDSHWERFVRSPDIADILQRHGVSADQVLDEPAHPLKERPLPDLCADRIDYVLRTGVHTKEIHRLEADAFLSALTILDSHWVFTTVEAAEEFAAYFLHINRTYYCGTESAVMFRTVGDLLRYSLQQGYLRHDDLFATDDSVLGTLRAHLHSDPVLSRLWRRMHGKVDAIASEAPDSVTVVCKSRVVDPWCVVDDRRVRLSHARPAWQALLAREAQPKRHRLLLRDPAPFE